MAGVVEAQEPKIRMAENCPPGAKAKPVPPTTPVARPAAAHRDSPWPWWIAGILTLALVAVNVAGATYYLAPLGVRVRHPLHPWLRSSGYVGQTLGILSLALFLFLWVYPIRKKYGARLAFTGRISAWLNWHVAAGLLVPWLAATHAGWRFTGLIGLGYAALFIVYLSGLVGRYLYTRIPRQKTGVTMSRDEVAAEREQILFELVAKTGLTPSAVRELLPVREGEGRGLGVVAAAREMIADDLARRRAAMRLEMLLKKKQKGTRALDRAAITRVLALARREMALSQQIRLLEATQKAFGLWHALHKPVAVTAFVAVAAHVIVAVAVGATWFH
jgi:hypothetical protein